MQVDFISGRIGVAVSGGMDSMALLNLLRAAKVDVCVINVEHGIRGAASERDSRFVKDYCLQNNLDLFFRRVNAPKEAEASGISLELAARNLRYSFFNELLLNGSVDGIALAHHADDNAETMLMRIFRGTGVRGLKGITERDKYIRPLLKFTRAEIAEYIKEENIPYVEDETNTDDAFTRNFIRTNILPAVKERYPEVLCAFTRLAGSAAETDEFLSSLILSPTETDYGCSLNGLFGLPPLIQKYSINSALSSMGAVQDIEYRHLNALIELKDKPNNSSIDLPFGITALKQNSDLHFYLKTEEIFTERKFDENITFDYRGFRYGFTETDGIIQGISMDADKVKNCIIRPRRNGDYFHRANGKNKLLSDFLNEKKLTKIEKDGLLVLAENNTVFAVLGLEVAEAAKIDNRTEKIIKTVKEKINL